MNFKIIYTACLFVFIIQISFAQTGIGTTTPEASAKLDVSATNKGFLPPRVTLTSGTDNTTIPSPATGLLVYNTGNNPGLVAGYYYWNATNWATIATATGSGVSSSYMRGSRTSAQTSGLSTNGLVVFTQIDQNAGQDISLNSSTGQITLAAGRTYRLQAQVPTFQTSASDARPQFGWYNETTGAYVGASTAAYSGGSTAGWGATGGLSDAVITTTVQTVVSFRIMQTFNTNQLGASGDFLATGSYPWFNIQVISGNTAVNGQSVDYVSVMLTTDQSNSAAGQNVKFQTIQSGNIPYDASTGNFSLTAGKTYRLTALASLNGTSPAASALDIIWRTADGVNIGPLGSLINASNNINFSGQGVVDLIYTPTRNITVSLYITFVGNSTTVLRSYATNATITQIGSSAIVNPWILSGNDVYNTTGKVGIGTNTPSVALDVNGTVNASTLNLSNTASTPSINIKNGDAAATFNDNAQIKMGWAGSAAGTSQYAQMIHTRHNAGTTGNAIDFYLSNGAANNSITSGSTKAMSIESPGNIDIPGKITLADPSGNVTVKGAGFVNAGVAVTLGDIQVIMSTGGSRSLQIRTTGSSFTGMVSAFTTYSNSAFTHFANISQTISGTYAYIGTTWGFITDGDVANYYVRDSTNLRFWRITLMVGPGYSNNFISIERLL